jgi:hypothetical protein
MQPPGEFLVLAAVGDEAGVELDASIRSQKRRKEANEIL